MAGAHQVVDAGFGIGKQPDGDRTVAGADPGADPVSRVTIDTDGEGRTPETGVGRGLRNEIKSFAGLAVECDAEIPTADPGHEVHEFRGHRFRGTHEIAFVLTIFVVDEHDHPTGTEFVEDFVDGGE